MSIPSSTGYPHVIHTETREFLRSLEIERRATRAEIAEYAATRGRTGTADELRLLRPISPEQGRANAALLLAELDAYTAAHADDEGDAA